ncbi:hypothetical protein SAMN05421788_108282 [Filimonas lacunae]|uniref:Uncharacterized protein n=1 Tax=Filimonas lacunae TaxID=477680 RepID=A0A173MDM2_9BACT|nr:hypothetical protein [Filimonas lacunae]BAV05579.1 hypothetical protein FLA_1586 [Filimonas lacunae]SIT29308.1 hypothetical protein SAMN05421788_108282 [Filimonas lacunae]
MESTQNENIIESYWELLKHLDVSTRLALIARLVQSLQAEVSSATGSFSGGSAASTVATGQANSDDTFWWDELES